MGSTHLEVGNWAGAGARGSRTAAAGPAQLRDPARNQLKRKGAKLAAAKAAPQLSGGSQGGRSENPRHEEQPENVAYEKVPVCQDKPRAEAPCASEYPQKACGAGSKRRELEQPRPYPRAPRRRGIPGWDIAVPAWAAAGDHAGGERPRQRGCAACLQGFNTGCLSVQPQGSP